MKDRRPKQNEINIAAGMFIPINIVLVLAARVREINIAFTAGAWQA